MSFEQYVGVGLMVLTFWWLLIAARKVEENKPEEVLFYAGLYFMAMFVGLALISGGIKL